MSDLIFHHYPNSPFSEKVRLIFGFKQLAWKSVLIPVIMPKPDVVALTGGYRRTPILQIGADIYCDSALICDVLEQRMPIPSLYPPSSSGMARTLAQWADSTLFWTAIAYAFQPEGMASMFAGAAPEQITAFAADRAAMRANAPRMPAMEATANLVIYLDRLEQMLAGGSLFLLGDAPTIADFSVYHPIWYVRRVKSLSAILDRAPALLAWADRIAALGHHQSEKLTSVAAIDIAMASTPVASGNAHDPQFPFALGEQVTIMPTDYACDPVNGVLVEATTTAVAIRRLDPRAGSLIVHFPRIGFQVRKTVSGEREVA